MVQIADLFTTSRFPGGVSAFMLVLYFPAGFLLAIFRAIFSIQFIIILSVLPKQNFIRSTVIKIYGFILGFVITSGVKDKNKANAKVWVANHVSPFDSLVIESVQPALQPYACCQYLPSYICWIMDYICERFSMDLSLNYIRDNIEDFSQPILVFPEETTTNGNTGLLKFNPAFVNLSDEPVQPIALFVSRPSTSKIAVSLIEVNFWMDLFWTFFVPFTHYHISYLPLTTKTDDDTDEDFAKRIQRDIAFVLDIAVTPFSVKEKREYVKKLHEEIQDDSREAIRKMVMKRPSPADQRLNEMTKQVKDVFPQCPIETIKKDILRTKDVNLTLTNILEGRVTYQALTQHEQDEERSKLETYQQDREKVDRYSEDTGYLSFQEKKAIMIEEARRKYLEKHPELTVEH